MKNLFQFLRIYKFNQNTFKKNSTLEKRIVLCEFSGNKSNQVAFSYLINVLNKKNNSECYSYINTLNFSFFDYLKIFIHRLTNFNIYKSFNVKKFIFTSKNKDIKVQKKKLPKKK